MSQLITKIKQKATEVKNETRPCMNTALRVGGLFEDIAEELDSKSEKLYIDVELGKVKTESKAYTDKKVAEIVNSAPETLDTLNELSKALGNDPNFATTIANQIGNKIDKVDGKGLSTNDFTNEEKTKLSRLGIEYDYIVDSDEKLEGLADNPNATRVLIKKGTWNSPVGIKLNPNTKVLIGEYGSIIAIAGDSALALRGLYYDIRPTTNDHYMQGLVVEVSNSGRGVSSGFSNCLNITNCIGNGINTSITPGYGFYNCSNITNCTGSGTGSGANTSNGKGVGIGFCDCSNITNCIGIGSGIGYGFYQCSNVTNCTGTGISTSLAGSYGFFECSTIFCCTAKNCNGRGFSGCTGVQFCGYEGSAATNGFNDTNCSFSPIYNTVNKVANTLNGGWNKV